LGEFVISNVGVFCSQLPSLFPRRPNNGTSFTLKSKYEGSNFFPGEAFYQERGHEAVILKEGDVIKCEKDIEHWHSSTKDSDVTYLALYGGGQPTTWTEVLTQEYYDGVAEKLKCN